MTKRTLFIIVASWLALSPITIARNSFQPVRNFNQVQHRLMISPPQKTYQAIRQHLNWLKNNEFDIAGVNWNIGTVEVITDDQGKTKLDQYRIQYSVVKTKKIGIESVTDGIDPRYYSPEKIEAKLKAINKQFPQYTRLEQIGTSNQGRAIWALLLSNTPNLNDPAYYNKPSIVIDGMHHAREIMTPEIVMDVADVVLSMKRNNSRWNQVFDSWNIWIVPMLNVDGNNIVWTQNSWWRKNARSDNNKVIGVDINRNYPYKWNACNGSSGSPSSDTYRGMSGGSEPETQALMRVGQLAQPVGSLSYHSYSEIVIYPYGCDGTFTGENALHQKIAKELADLLPTDDGKGKYKPGTPWQLLYSVDGDSAGYMHAEFGSLAFTIEVNQEFQPKYELREPTVIKQRKAWSYLIQRMSQNLLSLKVVDSTRRSVANDAIITISGVVKNQGEKPLHTNAAGNFFKVLDPGIYNINITLKNGKSKQIQVEMKGQPQAQVITL